MFMKGGVKVSHAVRRGYAIQVRVILALALALSVLAAVALPSPTAAQTWPTDTDWRLIDTDVDDPGGANHRDVLEASWSCDTNHLYLRLRTVDPPTFTAGPVRYKWYIDVGTGSNLYKSGGNIYGADYLLFVEDTNNDGNGEIYLVQADVNGQFGSWSTPYVPPITDPSVASYRITGNYIDMWVAFSALGRT